MRQVLDVNILEDLATQKRVARIGIPALVLGGLAAGYGMAQANDVGTGLLGSWWGWLLALVVLYAVSLPVHELVHALFFKVFGPSDVKITFGAKSGMLYVGCPGTQFPSWQMVVVLLAPCVALSLIYLLAGLIFQVPALMLCLFFLHLSGCAGDFYFTYLLATHPEADLVEDTDRGILLWSSR